MRANKGPHTMVKTVRAARPSACLLLALCAAALLSGCTRHFFRDHADEEVDSVLAEKDKYPDWQIDQFHVYPDPRARFADGTNPDRPPMPPDDPATREISPNPQKPGKAGVASVEGDGYLKLMAEWDEKNRAAVAEAKKAEGQGRARDEFNENVEQPGPDLTPSGKPDVYASTILNTEPNPKGPRPYLINLDQACELAVFNAREYQDAREDLYLTALPVTLERFSFGAEFFAATQAVRQWTGTLFPTNGVPQPGAAAAGNPPNSWGANSNFGFSKLFSTGALLLFNFANQTAFNLGPGRFVSSQSAINLDIVQPFLQGGGQAVTLEPLTQAERNLVYEIRNFARFRKELYVSIAGGGGGSIVGANFQPTGVLSAPTFFPSQGVGSTGIIPGSIPAPPITGNPGLIASPGPVGILGLQTALAAPVSGYLSTLLEAAQMKVDKFNIQKLESFFKLAKALQEGGDISQLQTDQFEQQLLGGRSRLLSDQQDYLQTIDQFKLQLGLPVDMIVELDDGPFHPLNEQFQRYEDLFQEFKTASDNPLRAGPAKSPADERKKFQRLFTSSALVRGTRFGATIASRWGAWEKLSNDDLAKRLAAYREQRRRLLDKQTDVQSKGGELSAADQEQLKVATNEIDLGDFEGTLREYETQPWKNLPDAESRRRRIQVMYGGVANASIVVLIQARNERMDSLHTKWPVLARVCVDGVDLLTADLDDAETACARHALAHRLDLMNVRAQVVDSWRQIAVYANALLAPVTAQYALTSGTPAGVNQPFDFGSSRTQQQLIFNWQLPLVRVQQRNNYRAALINLQRQRRVLQRAEDETAYDVRQELILLRQFLETYRIQTRQIELSYMVVENSLDTLQAPPNPTSVTAAVDTATRAASLTTQLINAQTSLYNAEFTMTTIWITYLNDRDQLYRDLELMPLDNRGVWIDNVEACECPKSNDTAAADKPAPQSAEPPPNVLPVPSEVPARPAPANASPTRP
jgi:Outer membrane efflux protein